MWAYSAGTWVRFASAVSENKGSNALQTLSDSDSKVSPEIERNAWDILLEEGPLK